MSKLISSAQRRRPALATRVGTPLLGMLLLATFAGCAAEDAQVDLADTEQAIDQTYGCHYEQMYVNNEMAPTTVPWTYCICGGASEPLSWDLGGGWHTMPWSYCYGQPVTPNW